MRIGIIGVRGIGNHHLNVLSAMDEFHVAAICDVDAGILAERAAGRELATYGDAAEMMDAERLDAVSLCTPPKWHLPHTRLAAERGIHVLCEKPMAPSVEDCAAMVDVCGSAGVALMIAQKKRFVRGVQRLRELLDGSLGQPWMLLHRYPHPWLPEMDWFWAEDDGGGPLLENAVHAADTLRFLLGEPVRVSAEGDTWGAAHRAPQLNCAVYTARFASGAIATVGAGMVALPAPGFMFEDLYVACEGGIAELSGDFDNPTRLRYAFRSAQSEVHEERFDGEDPFRAEFRHFLDCARDGREPLANGTEGLKSVAFALAVKQSARSGAAVELRSP